MITFQELCLANKKRIIETIEKEIKEVIQKNLERDSDWQERVVQIRRVSKTVKGGKKNEF